MKSQKTKNKQSNRDIAYGALREDIMNGVLRPGEKLIESKLCETYKIGRTPLRAIIRQLAGEGLLTLVPNQGATVSKLTIREIDEIYSIRAILEGFAVRLAAENIHPEQIDCLEKLQADLERTAADKNYPDWLAYNAQFHGVFQKGSKNSNLTRILGDLKDRVYRYQYVSITIPGHFEEYLEQHRRIIKYLRNYNPILAEKSMIEHMERVRSILADYLRAFPSF